MLLYKFLQGQLGGYHIYISSGDIQDFCVLLPNVCRSLIADRDQYCDDDSYNSVVRTWSRISWDTFTARCRDAVVDPAQLLHFCNLFNLLLVLSAKFVWQVVLTVLQHLHHLWRKIHQISEPSTNTQFPRCFTNNSLIFLLPNKIGHSEFFCGIAMNTIL